MGEDGNQRVVVKNTLTRFSVNMEVSNGGESHHLRSPTTDHTFCPVGKQTGVK